MNKQRNMKKCRKPLIFGTFLAPIEEFESPTYRLGGDRSILLSYMGIYEILTRNLSPFSVR